MWIYTKLYIGGEVLNKTYGKCFIRLGKDLVRLLQNHLWIQIQLGVYLVYGENNDLDVSMMRISVHLLIYLFILSVLAYFILNGCIDELILLK